MACIWSGVGVAQHEPPPFSLKLRHALQLIKEGNYSSACPMLDTICKLNKVEQACSWLVECYIKAGELKTAKQTLRTVSMPAHTTTAYHLAITWIQEQRTARLRRQLVKLARTINGSYLQVKEVLDIWERLELYRLAIQLIELGDLNSRSSLRLDKARLHVKAGEKEQAVKEYILAIVEGKGTEEAAKQELVRLCRNDTTTAQLVEKHALRWLDAFPTPHMAELIAMAWESAGNIEKAVYYATLYDRRFQLGGTVLLALATRLLASASTTSTGIQILAELVAEGNLSVRQQALSQLAAYLENNSERLTRQEIQQIWDRITDPLARLSLSPPTTQIKLTIYALACERLLHCTPLKELAHQLLKDPATPQAMQVRAHLALAHALQFEDSLWNAMRHLLLAEKQATGTLLEEVQLHLGQIAYFMGDFEFALLQLDKAQGATEQLTANDAIYLSTLIHEALHQAGKEPLQLFARAHLCALRGDTQCTYTHTDKLANLYPWTTLATESLWLRGLACWHAGNTPSAITNYMKLLQTDPSTLSADRTAYHLIQILHRVNQHQQAMDIYHLLEDHHPSSIYTSLARDLLTPALPR